MGMKKRRVRDPQVAWDTDGPRSKWAQGVVDKLMSKRSRFEMDSLATQCMNELGCHPGGTSFVHRTYEDGIVATLEWLYHDGEHPMESFESQSETASDADVAKEEDAKLANVPSRFKPLAEGEMREQEDGADDKDDYKYDPHY